MAGAGGGNEQSSTNNCARRQAAPPIAGASSPYSGAGGSSSWRTSLDGRSTAVAPPFTGRSGRRASKGSPPSASEANSSPSAHSIGSPIEGYCTPLINRKVPPAMAVAARNSAKDSATSQENPLRERMSISELVDTGLNTLTDENGSDSFKAHHTGEKRQGSGSSNSMKKPTPNYRCP